MGLPQGFKYLKNMAIYSTNDREELIENYGEDLEKKYDEADKSLHKERIFCLDCEDFKTCRGRFWQGCPHRAEVLKIIKEES